MIFQNNIVETSSVTIWENRKKCLGACCWKALSTYFNSLSLFYLMVFCNVDWLRSNLQYLFFIFEICILLAWCHNVLRLLGNHRPKHGFLADRLFQRACQLQNSLCEYNINYLQLILQLQIRLWISLLSVSSKICSLCSSPGGPKHFGRRGLHCSSDTVSGGQKKIDLHFKFK